MTPSAARAAVRVGSGRPGRISRVLIAGPVSAVRFLRRLVLDRPVSTSVGCGDRGRRCPLARRESPTRRGPGWTVRRRGVARARPRSPWCRVGGPGTPAHRTRLRTETYLIIPLKTNTCPELSESDCSSDGLGESLGQLARAASDALQEDHRFGTGAGRGTRSKSPVGDHGLGGPVACCAACPVCGLPGVRPARCAACPVCGLPGVRPARCAACCARARCAAYTCAPARWRAACPRGRPPVAPPRSVACWCLSAGTQTAR